ncbi:hypothetical protein OXPF_04670 [Oxobacter pfennigii]|uniref:PEGA domain protein n=1 Tax=Oxobacter pfennigii TaxID=36849 RepID=A0A0P8WTL4_9CLOT|nr:hypothetical protein [Oxobacter pfennigii]KPU45987.1 hypothetical protein OXPF_04670 [Oxobacter pfennigii]
MNKKMMLMLLLLLVFGIFYSIRDERYATIGVKDVITKEYIAEPEITLVPNISLEGQPGTADVGPYLYKPVVPMPVLITAQADGYKSEKTIIFLSKGKDVTIYLSKE